VGKGSFCCKWAYSAKLKKHMYLSPEYHLCLKQEHLAPCFPVRAEFVVESNTSCKLYFQDAYRIILLQLCVLSEVEETHVSLERKPSALEAGRSGTLFPCEN
jgi:hypothetical protein